MVLAIAGGLVVGGIAGALLAVPLLAVLNSGIRSLVSDADAEQKPEKVDVLEPQDTAPKDDKSERVKEL